MQVDDLSSIDPNVDYTQILPIQQKRTIAFVNNFVMNTVSLLNTFAQSCESRLMEFEYKLQKVEASLLILESQLSSISGLEDDEPAVKPEEKPIIQVDLPPVIEDDDVPITEGEPQHEVVSHGPAASTDPRFQRFFKMVQFGVPPQAVKLKMQTEGIDPNILDTPSAVIPGSPEMAPHSDSSDSS